MEDDVRKIIALDLDEKRTIEKIDDLIKSLLDDQKCEVKSSTDCWEYQYRSDTPSDVFEKVKEMIEEEKEEA